MGSLVQGDILAQVLDDRLVLDGTQVQVLGGILELLVDDSFELVDKLVDGGIH